MTVVTRLKALVDAARGRAPAAGAREAELRALLDEVRALRQDIDVLKANPVIGDAVSATLEHASRMPGYERSGYAVLVKPAPDLERLASYNVLVAPDLERGGRPPED